ncbi:MAG: hypothetical protein ABI134_08265 [Byssovorax sp.]
MVIAHAGLVIKGGVDTHTDKHTVRALDATGRQLGNQCSGP